ETAEGNGRARGAELGIFAGRRRRAEANGDGRAGRILHLRRDRALPDQVVERELVARQLDLHLLRRAEAVAGGTRRLLRLLRVLHLAVVLARPLGDILRPVELPSLVARRLQRRFGERRRVGAHIGDVAVLVQTLCDAHRRLRRETELAARLLLERRRHERRRRSTRVRLLLDVANREQGAVERTCDPAVPPP